MRNTVLGRSKGRLAGVAGVATAPIRIIASTIGRYVFAISAILIANPLTVLGLVGLGMLGTGVGIKWSIADALIVTGGLLVLIVLYGATRAIRPNGG